MAANRASTVSRRAGFTSWRQLSTCPHVELPFMCKANQSAMIVRQAVDLGKKAIPLIGADSPPQVQAAPQIRTVRNRLIKWHVGCGCVALRKPQLKGKVFFKHRISLGFLPSLLAIASCPVQQPS